MNDISELIGMIKSGYYKAQDFLIREPTPCAATIRTALENGIKLFYIVKYGYTTKNIDIEFKLFDAIEDSRFKPYFDELIINDMHGIRKSCNAVIHSNTGLTVEKATDLMDRLKKCINAIEKQLNISIITPAKADITDTKIKTERKYISPEIQSKYNDRPALPHPLVANLKRGFGGRAQSIYDAGCDEFGWEKRKRGDFAMMKLLYATGATPEGHSVWCLCHVNRPVSDERFINWSSADKTLEDHNWANILFTDGSFIYEIWKDIGPDFPGYHNDMTTRLTFIKCSYTNNKYAFGGIYKPTKLENRIANGKVYHIKVYERIAETYGE